MTGSPYEYLAISREVNGLAIDLGIIHGRKMNAREAVASSRMNLREFGDEIEEFMGAVNSSLPYEGDKALLTLTGRTLLTDYSREFFKDNPEIPIKRELDAIAKMGILLRRAPYAERFDKYAEKLSSTFRRISAHTERMHLLIVPEDLEIHAGTRNAIPLNSIHSDF